MGKARSVETQTRKSKRTVRTTETVTPLPMSKVKSPGQSSGAKHKDSAQTGQVNAPATGNRSHVTEESYAVQVQDDDGQVFDLEEEFPKSTVCIAAHIT
jgi:hypothetical protein